MVTAYVGVGSNLGDRVSNCTRAAVALGKLPETSLRIVSPFYETEPEDGAGPQRFVNAVAVLETALAPARLLAALQHLEGLAGRAEERARGKNRTLDLDLLLYGDQVLAEPGLVVPHPRLHRRRFVLVPLCDVAPGVVHPALRRPLCDLLAALDPGPGVHVVPTQGTAPGAPGAPAGDTDAAGTAP
jgi:2-amino-4-hydroxy-6-hydroxymethyldihydropteridine diphosphokinase